jgi:hypothetical protein
MSGIDWNDAAIEDLLKSMDGPVGKFILEKTQQMTAMVRADAPVQKPENYSWGKRSSSYEPRSAGYLKGGVHSAMGYTKTNQLYGGVNAPYGPTLFLEQPARQLHEKIPFMSSALYAATID